MLRALPFGHCGVLFPGIRGVTSAALFGSTTTLRSVTGLLNRVGGWIVRSYTVLLACTVAGIALLAIAPVVASLLLRLTGRDPMMLIGIVHTVSERKVEVFRILTIAAAGGVAGLWLLTLRAPLAGRRLAQLLIALPVLATPAALLDLASPVAMSAFAERFDTVQLPSLYLPEFQPGGALRGRLRDYDAFHAAVDSAYAGQGAVFAASVPDTALRRVLFLTNLVSQLWGVGNLRHPEKSGCVRGNEERSWLPDAQASLPAYLATTIGCCDDFAHLLKVLLDRDGLKNRLVVAGGHIFNEVMLEGRWHVLDANFDVAFEGSWTELGLGSRRVRMYSIPHPGADVRNREIYRPGLWASRVSLITTLYRGVFQTIYRDSLPDHFYRASVASR